MSYYSEDYEVPAAGGAYMKFEQGENRIRVLSKPIVGAEYWVDADGVPRPRNSKPATGDSPVRVKAGEKVPNGAVARFFNAMVVYNYKAKEVQILEITQKGILSNLLKLDRNPKWGDLRTYDIVIEREGEGLDTSYAVLPEPKTDIDAGIVQLYKDLGIKLDEMFKPGGDPFNPPEREEEVDPDEVDKALTKRTRKSDAKDIDELLGD